MNIEELERAAAQAPGDAALLNRLGSAYKEAGKLERAEICYRNALAASPEHAASLYNLAMVLHLRNQLEEAEALFRRLALANRKDLEVWTHLATILCKRGRYAEGGGAYLKALELAPLDPFLWTALANTVLETGDPVEEAVRFLNRALELNPDIAGAWLLLGVARRRLRLEGVVDAFERALALDPALLEALNGIGHVLRDEGRLAEAEARYRSGLSTAPASALLWNGLGCVLFEQSRLEDASQAFLRAIALDPELAHAQQNLGAIHAQRGEREDALRCFSQALKLHPGDAAIRESLLYEMQQVCDWSRLDDLWQRQQASLAEATPAITPFSLVSLPASPSEQRRCAGRWAAQFTMIAGPERERLAFRFARGPRQKLRIGYLSADFHDHVTPYVMAELIELHDRGGFEIFAYSYGPDDGSAMRRRLLAAFDRFVDVRALTHRDAAARIHADGIDILVDLKGYTEHARTGIMALRPAPVQVNYLAYPGTMDADFIDYLIGDRYVLPPSQRAHYGEALVLMPHTFFVTDRTRGIPAPLSRAAAGLPADRFVFCCFNQTFKILPDTFSRWMRVMVEVPGSVLWLLDASRLAKENLRREAEARGVAGERLIFAPRVPAAMHLQRLAAADLCLDTLPCNAHTTAADALWAGLPVLTLPGETFASRVAGSLLTALDLQDLIAVSEDEWHRMALDLAREPGHLAALRARIREKRDAAGGLFDTPAYTRALEEAYRRMWDNFASGRPPSPIEL
jgi:protein O-GlcNAc transferase